LPWLPYAGGLSLALLDAQQTPCAQVDGVGAED
jgi:hypothetical protein